MNIALTADSAPAQPSGTRRFDILRRILLGHPSTIVATLIVASFMTIAIFAPLLAPYDPLAQSILSTNELPSGAHWLGTDQLGRDVLSRLIYGSRNSLLFGLIAPTLAAFFGTLLGVTAGYFGGLVDRILTRIIDLLLAFPELLLAIVIAAVLGGQLLERPGGADDCPRARFCARGARLHARGQAGALRRGRDRCRRHDAENHHPPCDSEHRGADRGADDTLGCVGHPARGFTEFPGYWHAATEPELGQHHP